MSEQRRERARGVLLGQAAGDALGTTTEFMSPSGVAQVWPQGLHEIVGGGTFRVLPGQITDDTEMALALARSLIRRGAYDVEDAAQSYIRWAASDPFDMGGTTGQAFGRPAASAAAVLARANAQSQANGALMRISPLAVRSWSWTEQARTEAVCLDARLSHPHPLCQAANAIYAHAIAFALREGGSSAELWAEARAYAHRHALCQPLIEELEAPDLPEYYRNMGWVRIAFRNAFWWLREGRPFAEALSATVQQGGDADTNGAIAGALLGAVAGEAGIPLQWRQAVLSCRAPRPAEFCAPDLLELADQLAEG